MLSDEPVTPVAVKLNVAGEPLGPVHDTVSVPERDPVAPGAICTAYAHTAPAARVEPQAVYAAELEGVVVLK